MKLKPYPAYKDSGVEWLGDVPKVWRKSALKFLAEYQNGFAFKPEDWSEEGLPIIRIAQLTSDAEPSRFLGEIDKRNFVKNGDLLFSWSATLDTFIWQGGNAWLNQHIFKVSPTAEADKKFLYWLLKVAAQKLSDIDAHGSTMKHIKKESLGERVYIPTIDVQDRIATFLDRETAKLDTLISKQEKLIELLQEKRQAVISHVVTKGLDPDAPMKDSGVEWLGMVPESWTVLQFRHMVSIQNGSDYKHIESDDGPYPVIGSGGEFRRATDYIYDGISVLLGRKGTIDKPLYIEGKFWVVDTMFYTIIKDIVLPKYVFNCAKIIPFDLLSTSTALPSMTQNDLKTLYFAMPNSLSEQESIISYIDVQTTKIDTQIDKAKRSIELAKEHRTALISAAVTGKIDVRNYAMENTNV